MVDVAGKLFQYETKAGAVAAIGTFQAQGSRSIDEDRQRIMKDTGTGLEAQAGTGARPTALTNRLLAAR